MALLEVVLPADNMVPMAAADEAQLHAADAPADGGMAYEDVLQMAAEEHAAAAAVRRDRVALMAQHAEDPAAPWQRPCCICLEPIGMDEAQLLHLPCHETHIFHAACMASYWKDDIIAYQGRRCPLCRVNIDELDAAAGFPGRTAESLAAERARVERAEAWAQIIEQDDARLDSERAQQAAWEAMPAAEEGAGPHPRLRVSLRSTLQQLDSNHLLLEIMSL